MNKIIENRGDVSFAYAGITDSIHIITAEKTFSFNGLCDILIDFKDSDRCAIIPLNNKIGTAKNMPIAQMIKTAICTKIFLPFKQWTGVGLVLPVSPRCLLLICPFRMSVITGSPVPQSKSVSSVFCPICALSISKRLLKNSCSSCIDFTSLHRILSFFLSIPEKNFGCKKEYKKQEMDAYHSVPFLAEGEITPFLHQPKQYQESDPHSNRGA